MPQPDSRPRPQGDPPRPADPASPRRSTWREPAIVAAIIAAISAVVVALIGASFGDKKETSVAAPSQTVTQEASTSDMRPSKVSASQPQPRTAEGTVLTQDCKIDLPLYYSVNFAKINECPKPIQNNNYTGYITLTAGNFLVTNGDTKFATLTGVEPTYQSCESNTRYTTTVSNVEKFVGKVVCITGPGYIVAAKIEDYAMSPTFVTLNMTVWQAAPN